MDALILSCGTGGGHNAAGFAIKEELKRRGHQVEMFDPYTLVGDGLSALVANAYFRLVQKAPRLFGAAYRLGNFYRLLPFRSPVYFINQKPAEKLKEYLTNHHVDVIIMPHLFPAEIVTCLKNEGIPMPKTVFIATDYTCIPFTEETDCDYYIIPHEDLMREFKKRGILAEKLKPFGIPVQRAFDAGGTKAAAKEKLGLSTDKNYLLLAGGSVGAGHLKKTVRAILSCIRDREDIRLIVICGNNRKLYAKLRKHYGERVILLQSTNQMALYMKASDLFFTKPGGLSSTEVVTAGIPLVHISPIPGCETKNRAYFAKRGISVAVWNGEETGIRRLKQILRKKDITCNRTHIHTNARQAICDWLEQDLCK